MRSLNIALFLLFLALSSIFSPTFAQDFFGGSQKTESEDNQKPAFQVLSPQEFRSTVATLGQQTKNSIAEELNAQIAKRPPIPIQEPTPPPISSATAVNQPAPLPPQSAATSTAPAQVTPPPQQQPPAATPPPNVEVPQQQTEIYSGFQGTQNTQKNNTQQSGQPTGGWGIKY